MILCSLVATLALPRVHILLIGASQYEFPLTNGVVRKESLSGERDVAELARVFQTRVFPKECTVFCKSVTDLKISRRTILDSIDQFLVAPAVPGDTVIFWWSGHGVRTRSGSGTDLQAIVPPIVDRDPDGRITYRSLVYGRELSARFEFLESKGVNCSWFLDSCYSGEAARNSWTSRLDAAPIPDNELPQAVPERDRKSVLITASSKTDAVREVTLGGERIGLLTALVCRAFSAEGGSPKESQSARGFIDLLKRFGISLGTAAIPEAEGDLNRRMFSVERVPFSWVFPIAVPRSSRPVWLESLGQVDQLDSGRETIPAGLMDGIREGDLADVTVGRFVYKYKVSKALLGISQLMPIGPSAKGAEAGTALVLPRGLPRVFVEPGCVTQEALNKIASSSMNLVANQSISTHKVGKVSGRFNVSSSGGLMLAQFSDENDLVAGLPWISNAERLRNSAQLPNSSITVEMQLVKLNPDKTARLEKRVLEAPWITGKSVSANDCFTLRFRLKSSVKTPTREVYVGLLYISPKHDVSPLTISRSTSAKVGVSYDAPTDWLYLSRAGELKKAEEMQNSGGGSVTNFGPDPRYFDSDFSQLTLIASESPVDLSSYLSQNEPSRGMLPLQMNRIQIPCFYP